MSKHRLQALAGDDEAKPGHDLEQQAEAELAALAVVDVGPTSTTAGRPARPRGPGCQILGVCVGCPCHAVCLIQDINVLPQQAEAIAFPFEISVKQTRGQV